jgi:hypothetical protein
MFSEFRLKVQAFFQKLVGKNTDAVQAQIEFHKTFKKVEKAAVQLRDLATQKYDAKDSTVVAAHEASLTTARKDLASAHQALLQLAADKGEEGTKAAREILESEVGKGINDLALRAATVQTLVGPGTEMTQDTLGAFLRANGSLATEGVMSEETARTVDTTLSTVGIHKTLFPTLQALNQRLDEVMAPTFTAEAADLEKMKGTFVAAVQGLVNGNTPITSASLDAIQYEGISLAQVLDNTVDSVVADLEKARADLVTLKANKQTQAGNQLTLDAAKANALAAQGKIDASTKFTLVQIAASNGQDQMSVLRGGVAGSMIVDKIARMTKLEVDIPAARTAQATTVDGLVTTEKAAHTAATTALSTLEGEIADLKAECEKQSRLVSEKSALIAGSSPTAKALVKDLDAKLKAGDVAGIAKLFTDNGATFAPVLQLQQEKTAAETALGTASGQLAAKQLALPTAKKLVEDMESALAQATKIHTNATNGAIKALEDELAALKAETFSFTGQELIDLKTAVPTLAGDVDAKAVEALAENSKLTTAKKTEQEMTDANVGLVAEFTQALAGSALSTIPFTLDETSMQVTVAKEFLIDDVVEAMTEDLTIVRRDQEKEEVSRAIVLGKVMLEHAAATAKQQIQEATAANAHLAALPMTAPEYQPLVDYKALMQGRTTGGLVVVEDTTGNGLKQETMNEHAQARKAKKAEEARLAAEALKGKTVQIDARGTSFATKLALVGLGLATTVGAGLVYSDPTIVTEGLESLVGGFSSLFNMTVNMTAPVVSRLALPSPDDFTRVVPYIGPVVNGATALVPYVGKIAQQVLGNGVCPVPSTALAIV